MTFARTKIQPPRPRTGALVDRPQLQTRLAEALATQRLVLVSAAAGYGKTTALARQLERLPAGTALAWVAADEGDDLHRLLECLVAALEPFDPPWRTAPEALIAQADDPHARGRVAAELLNALEACDVGHGIVVFDDLHRVDDAPFFEFVDLLLERLGTRWTVVASTRHDPPLALARLRARGELAEFRQADLEFDRAEVRALAGALGIDAAGADALLERTHGWAAGLRLGVSRGSGRAPVASDRAMFDFLAAEVIDQLEPELRRFLLQTSVLPELTAARAAAVSGNARAAQLIEQVDRLGLFVTTLDAAEPTLKLHDLFRAALGHRLRSECPDECPLLWQRAAVGESDPARKLLMMLHAGDLDAAAETLAAQVGALLTDGALSTVAHLVAQFPPAFVAASPVMQLVRGLAAWARWDFPAMLDAMGRAESGFAAAGGDRADLVRAYQALALNALGRNADSGARLATLRPDRATVESRVVMLVAGIWLALDVGAPRRVGALLEELLDVLERSDDASLWYRAHPLPRINGLPGTAAPLRRYVDGALRLAGDRPLPLRALARLQAGWRHAWQEGDLDAAEAAFAVADADCRWLGDPPNVRGSLQLLALFVHALRGARAPALAAAQALVDDHPAARGGWSLWANVYYAARFAALFDDRALLEAHLGRLEAQGADIAVPPTQAALLLPLQAQRARLRGDRGEAVRLWRAALADEDAIDRLGHAVETRLFLAAALLDEGAVGAAADALRPAFARIAAGGIGAALLARAPLRRLAAAAWSGALDAADRAALQRWQTHAGDAGAAAPVPAPAVPGALSARELEVVARIAAGDSNKLIARAFDLSPHTVKRHVANILDKLGAESRAQAAAWYLRRQRA